MTGDSLPFVVIITGLSGAGHTTALNALADNGLYCIDNLPVELLDEALAVFASGRLQAPSGYALCMDIRDKRFVADFPRILTAVRAKARLKVIFLTCDDQIIFTRYSTTRRRHPLMGDGDTLQEAVDRERELLAPLEEKADHVFDTTSWSPHDLARAVEHHLAADLPPRALHVTITSFGFKWGQHRPIDSLFDVRFVRNPHFIPGLKEKSGIDQEVRDYVFEDESARQMLDKMEEMQRFLLPLYHQEGKHYFRIGIGCSGGRHRSVAFAEELGKRFLAKPIPNTVITVIHRDIDR